MEGAGKKKKFTQLQELERSQEQHPIPERFPWRQVWQRTMRVRETDERERAGEEEEGGLLASRFSWWVPEGGGAGGLSTQKDSGKYDGAVA